MGRRDSPKPPCVAVSLPRPQVPNDVGSMGNCGRGSDTATHGSFVFESRFGGGRLCKGQINSRSILQGPITNSFVACPSLFPRVFGLTNWPRMGLLPRVGWRHSEKIKTGDWNFEPTWLR